MKSIRSNITIGILLSTVPKYSETFFRNKIKGLQENGFEVIIYANYKTKYDQKFPCKVIIAPNYGKGFLSSFYYGCVALIKCIFQSPRKSVRHFKLDRKDGFSIFTSLKRLMVNEYLLRKNVDWLHFGFGILAEGKENVAKAIKAKMAVSFRGYDLYLSPLMRPDCYDLLFKKKIQYHVLSEEMKKDLVAKSISQEQVEVITPAIDTSFFKPIQVARENKIVQITTVARLHWKKGLVYSLEALRLLKARGVSFKYTIIGEGDQLERLKFAIYQMNLQNEVYFAGKLSQESIREQLARTDIYIQYSIQEGFCNAVLEAQAMGLLCVVSNAEGLSENVSHLKSGWVVEKRQPELLTEQLIEIINLPDSEKDRIRQFAVSRIQETFKLEQQNAAFKEFYVAIDS